LSVTVQHTDAAVVTELHFFGWIFPEGVAEVLLFALVACVHIRMTIKGLQSSNTCMHCLTLSVGRPLDRAQPALSLAHGRQLN